MKIASAVLIGFVLGGAFAKAQAPAEKVLSHEKQIAEVCQSAKAVLVLDTFPGDPTNQKNIDLDGDGEYDLHHGEFVSRLVELNGQKVVFENVGTPILSTKFVNILNSWADRIEQGAVQISWINFSQGYPVDFESFNKLMGYKGVINSRNIHEYAEAILETLWTTRPQLKLKELYAVLKRLERLQVPLIVAATNSGFNEVNLYSLFPNVISVGALNVKGGKAPYSADNSTVTIWRQGDLPSFSVAGGIDVTMDGVADFSHSVPEIPTSLIQSLNGVSAYQVVKSIPADILEANDDNRAQFHELAAKLPVGLYDTREVLKKTLATPFQQGRYIMGLGAYFYMDGQHPKPLLFVPTLASGEIQLDVSQLTPGRQFRVMQEGTSFAAPNLCRGLRSHSKVISLFE